MLDYNPVTKTAGKSIATARAAVAIYLALLDANITEGSVLVPANLCYAGIFPAVYAGLTPVFCDVDRFSGNVTRQSVEKALDSSVKAAIIPHMYGNPIPDMIDICRILKENNVLIIEDCASAMGAESNLYPLGDMGDYTVYSTGKAKTVDLGFGGILCSKISDLSKAEEIKASLTFKSSAEDNDSALFSRLYRLLRNEGENSPLAEKIYPLLASLSRDDFLFNLDTATESSVFSATDKLDEIVAQRQADYSLYKSLVKAPFVSSYEYNEGAVPWRYSFFMEEKHRKAFIAAALEKGLPVSDWYPNITAFFGQKIAFEGADIHEKTILNFPLLIGEENITNICNFINCFFDEI